MCVDRFHRTPIYIFKWSIIPGGCSLHRTFEKQLPDFYGNHKMRMLWTTVGQWTLLSFIYHFLNFPPILIRLVLSFPSLSPTPLPFFPHYPSPTRSDVFPESPLNKPSSVGLPPEKLGGWVNASDAYFYTPVCPESDVVYHSLSKGPLFSTSRRMLLYWLLVRQPGSLWRSFWMKLDNFH